MPNEDWTTGVDTTIPNVARIYDYQLGGSHNFEADRMAAKWMNDSSPNVRPSMRENRHFLRRVVHYLVGQGVRQFLDIGSGLPTRGNVHELAPQANIVYVDNDPVVMTHMRALVAYSTDRVRAVQQDVRRPQELLSDPTVRMFLDWENSPVAVLMLGLLHFVHDSDGPADIIGTFRDALPPGSYLAISHGTATGYQSALADQRRLFNRVKTVYARATSPTSLRDQDQVTQFFAGFDLVDPGVVFVPEWRPDGVAEDIPPAQTGLYGGVGKLQQK
ncbi:SAM-dependent methyltransferase [Sphaerisporangium album]|uniref:SAM-dependent methyltransferase n=1 Tax=Sphaerisporangium album TaxID=509200 RepID=A0A367EFM9_9ACTN|nr:SAM-dependent methyltransferase [Sphaerisporangium album]RCG16864.1 SAM-dependent methyltransferase [Sphaerisporangium album]